MIEDNAIEDKAIEDNAMGHGRKISEHAGNSGGGSDNLRSEPPQGDTGPVCGKTVRTDRAEPSVDNCLVTYFCLRECRGRFEAAADLFLRPLTEGAAQQRQHAHA